MNSVPSTFSVLGTPGRRVVRLFIDSVCLVPGDCGLGVEVHVVQVDGLMGTVGSPL